MAAIVAHDPLRDAGRAGSVEDVERVGGGDRDAIGRRRGGDEVVPMMVAPRYEVGPAHRALQNDAVRQFAVASAIAASISGL